MWEDWLPHYLAIGISKYDFFHSTPKELQAYDKAYEIRRNIQDEQDWMLGLYFYEAVSVVVGNALRKKTAKPLSFRDKPILKELEEKRAKERPLTEDEKNAAISALFANLESMQARFEATHKK